MLSTSPRSLGRTFNILIRLSTAQCRRHPASGSVAVAPLHQLEGFEKNKRTGQPLLAIHIIYVTKTSAGILRLAPILGISARPVQPFSHLLLNPVFVGERADDWPDKQIRHRFNDREHTDPVICAVSKHVEKCTAGYGAVDFSL